MKNKRELRFVPFDLQVRTVDSDGENKGMPILEGHAAVFDQWSENLGGFVERVKPGAFKKTIQEADVRALWNHDPNYVLGRRTVDTLELSEDAVGLVVVIHPPNTQWARDLVVSVRRGDVDQMSFGFRVIKEEWEEPELHEDPYKRTLLEVELCDVSLVTFPAYVGTDIGARSLLNSMSMYVPEPPQQGHSDNDSTVEDPEPEQARHSNDLLRKRLDLLDIEF